MSNAEQKPIAYECRFATYCKGMPYSEDDLHVIKEIQHFADGTSRPFLRLKKNHTRPIYVTKKGMRNHKDNKEWEKLENLDRYETRQKDLVDTVAKALGRYGWRGTLRDLCEEYPYVFGGDISSTSYIKQMYVERWSKQTEYTVASFDTETDMLDDSGEIIMATISYKHRVYTAVKKHFVRAFPQPERAVREMFAKLLGDDIKQRGLVLEIDFVENEIDIVRGCMNKAHEWMPDFIGVWNIGFDMKKMLEACKRANVDPAMIFSDPKVPDEFKFFRFKEGKAKKTSASGRVMNFKPSQQWHSVFTPASFTFIDSMQAYVKVRQGEPELPSYALDDILQKEIKRTKLKIKEAEKYKGAAWHVYMQREQPIVYIVYNIFDSVGMEILDEKTKDLALSLPMFAGTTDFCDFNSLPKRAMNEIHWFIKELDQVTGTTAKDMKTDLDENTNLSGLIVMLPSHLVADNGKRIIEEDPTLRTNIRTHTAD